MRTLKIIVMTELCALQHLDAVRAELATAEHQLASELATSQQVTYWL